MYITENWWEGPVAEAVVDVKERNVDDAREAVDERVADEYIVEGSPLAFMAQRQSDEQGVEEYGAHYNDQLADWVERRLDEKELVAVNEFVKVDNQMGRLAVVLWCWRGRRRLVRRIWSIQQIHFYLFFLFCCWVHFYFFSFRIIFFFSSQLLPVVVCRDIDWEFPLKWKHTRPTVFSAR